MPNGDAAGAEAALAVAGPAARAEVPSGDLEKPKSNFTAPGVDASPALLGADAALEAPPKGLAIPKPEAGLVVALVEDAPGFPNVKLGVADADPAVEDAC